MPFADDGAGKKYRAEYYLKHRDEIRRKAREYYEANRAVCNERVKKYEARLGKPKVLAYRRLHNKKYNEKLRDEVIAAYGGKWRLLCMNCNQATRYGDKCPHQKINTQSLIEGMAC